MGSYVKNTLLRDEDIIYEAKVSWWSQIGLIIAGIILSFVFGIGLLLLIIAYLNVKTTELALTNKRVIAKFGFIRRTTVELRVEKIESLGVDQGILGRLLGYGSIVVRGSGGTNTPIPNIANPLEFRHKVNFFVEELSKQP